MSTAAAYKTSSAAAEQRSIFHPVADFFAVGGFSFVLLGLGFLIGNEKLKEIDSNIAYFAFGLSFFINFPHFAYSYQLLYRDFFGKLRNEALSRANRFRYFFAGIIAPVLLIACLGWAIIVQDKILLGYAVNVMFFSVGWHYIKQGFGILVVLSGRQKIYFKRPERLLLLGHAYAVWIYSWLKVNLYANERVFTGFPYSTFDVPDSLIPLSRTILLALGVALAISMMLKFVSLRRLPPISAFTGYLCALYPWLLFPYVNILLLYLVPALHSLQYLVFVWKLESEKVKEQTAADKEANQEERQRKYRLQLGLFIVLGVVLGIAGFNAIPNTLDNLTPFYKAALGAPIFIFAFHIFINIHHYFIDSAIWRRDNPDLKYLFY